MNKFILIIIISLISIPSLIFAQNSVSNDEYTLLEPLPCVSGYSNTNDCTVGETIPKINFSDYISYAYRLAIALSVFLAIVMIMWGGFEYMTSEIPSTKSDGKTRMTDAIIGLLLVLSSYLILETIDPRLVAVNTELPKVKIDIRDSVLFKNSLSEDLKNIRTEDIESLKKSAAQIKGINETITSIKRAYENKEITEEEYQRKIAPYKAEIMAEEFKIAQTVTRGVGVIKLSESWNTLTRNVNSNLLGIPDYSSTDTTIKQTEDTYSRYIRDIEKGGNFEGAEKLKKEKKFIVDEIKESKKAVEIANTYYQCFNSIPCRATTSAENIRARRQDVRNLLDRYKKELDLKGTSSADFEYGSDLGEKYKKVLSDRIQYLELSLKDK